MCLGDISVRSLAAHSTGCPPSSQTTLYDFSLTVLIAGQARSGPMKTAAYQGAMPLHQRAIAARNAALLNSMSSGACPHPPTPQRA